MSISAAKSVISIPNNKIDILQWCDFQFPLYWTIVQFQCIHKC